MNLETSTYQRGLMELTVRMERLGDGRYRATTVEMPSISYVGKTEAEVTERMNRLLYALRSPHIKIDRIMPSGEVILILDRTDEEDEDVDPPTYSARSICSPVLH